MCGPRVAHEVKHALTTTALMIRLGLIYISYGPIFCVILVLRRLLVASAVIREVHGLWLVDLRHDSPWCHQEPIRRVRATAASQVKTEP